MKDTILKVGDKAKGFKFEGGTDGVGWVIGKETYIGKVGEVLNICPHNFAIRFDDGTGFYYPISLMHLAVVEDEQLKKLSLKIGDKAQGFKFEDGTDGVTWGISKEKYIGKIGKITLIGNDYFGIDFNDGCGFWLYPTSLMHLAVLEEEQPKVIVIDVNEVEKVEFYHSYDDVWYEMDLDEEKYRFTFKDEIKLKLEKKIKELEDEINELKKQL